MSTLLEIRHLSMSFPGLRALNDVSLTVDAGEIVAVVGQNGSGKSTLVKVLAGLHHPDPGSEVVQGAGPDGSAVGLHFIHQDLGLVGGMSTVENLDLDRMHGYRSLLPAPRRAERRHAERVIAEFGASFDVRRPILELSAAERTIVAIARALDGWQHPGNVLVLDEPTASLHGDEVQKLFVAVREVAERGAGVIFISHRLDEVVELADRVVVLRDGRVDRRRRTGSVRSRRVGSADRGRDRSTDADHEQSDRSDAVLRARGISGATVHALDIDIHAGEIVGLTGVLGSGREEVASILFGAAEGKVDELTLGDQPVSAPNPRRSIETGIAYVPGDRHRHGAVMAMSARENMTLPRMRSLRRAFGWLDKPPSGRRSQSWIERVEGATTRSGPHADPVQWR